ncbi:hypothetical protein EJB05_21160, partial [Eragrostis curvula]
MLLRISAVPTLVVSSRDAARDLRKVAVTELLSARRVLSFRAVREEEVAAALRAVAADAQPVDLRARLSELVADTAVRAVVGGQWKHRDVFLRELDRTIKLASAFNQASVCPSSWLAGLVSGNVRRAEAWRDTVFGLLDGVISEHLERTDDGRSGGEAEDLLDVLPKLQKSGDIPFAPTWTSLKLSCS